MHKLEWEWRVFYRSKTGIKKPCLRAGTQRLKSKASLGIRGTFPGHISTRGTFQGRWGRWEEQGAGLSQTNAGLPGHETLGAEKAAAFQPEKQTYGKKSAHEKATAVWQEPRDTGQRVKKYAQLSKTEHHVWEDHFTKTNFCSFLVYQLWCSKMKGVVCFHWVKPLPLYFQNEIDSRCKEDQWSLWRKIYSVP